MKINQKSNIVAIMQPYFFPYIGYFQLINAVDKFIFYDDVNFIKNGWINRNRIMINSQATYLTVQLKNASSFKLISEVEFTDNRPKLKKTIMMAYKKAKYFDQVWPLIEACLYWDTYKISDLAIHSVKTVCNYLGIQTEFEISGMSYPETKSLQKEDRVIEICKNNGAMHYVNSLGGIELYDKKYFMERGIKLEFLKSNIVPYNQNTKEFIPGLSIIDVMMFNPSVTIGEFLQNYELI